MEIQTFNAVTPQGDDMPEIILKTDMPDKATKILLEALETESFRLKYSMQLAKRRLSKFEKKYSFRFEATNVNMRPINMALFETLSQFFTLMPSWLKNCCTFTNHPF